MKSIAVILVSLGLVGLFVHRRYTSDTLPAKAQLLCDVWQLVEHPLSRHPADKARGKETASSTP